MPADAVDVVRRAAEAAFRKPEPDWAVLDASVDPEHEFHSLVDNLEGGRIARGAGGFRQWRARLDELFEWTMAMEDVRSAGDGRVLVVSRTHLVGLGGGVEIDFVTGNVVTLRNGLLWRTVAYPTVAEALAAVGLEEA